MWNLGFCNMFWFFCFLATWSTIAALDECALGVQICTGNTVCVDVNLTQNGTAVCLCKPGYSGDATLCEDINECELEDPCKKANAICENTDGSFLCLCGRNFIEDDGVCVDVNECASDSSNNCDVNADCINVVGSYNCSCKGGFRGNGFTCTDIDECGENTHDCDGSTQCTNVAGSYNCTCSINVGVGKSCRAESYCPQKDDNDVDECSAALHDCHRDAMCVDTRAGFICVCKSGFNGDGKECTENDENDDRVVILVSIAIALLALCLIGIVVMICCIFRK